MPGSRHTKYQILAALAECRDGASSRAVCKRMGISLQTLYRWRKKYAAPAAGNGHAPPPPQARAGARAVRLPDSCSLESAQRLLEFVNTTSGGGYRLVLDQDGMALERGA